MRVLRAVRPDVAKNAAVAERLSKDLKMTELVAVSKEQLNEIRRYVVNNCNWATDDFLVSQHICDELQKLIDSPPLTLLRAYGVDYLVTPKPKGE